jgi:hypothetical protein
MSSNQPGIHPKLLLAYRATNYVVFAPSAIEFVLRIATVSKELAQRMHVAGVSTAAYLTAFNPFSESRSPGENAAAQASLKRELSSRGLVMLDGEGRDAAGQWPAEPSVLALGISRHDADRLARQFGQNAYVWVGNASGLASLRLLRPVLIPNSMDLATWRSGLPVDEAAAASQLAPREQALLISVPPDQLAHWLYPEKREITNPWPLTLPDGGTMGAGSEMDRMFRLVAAGLVPHVQEFVQS